jgi:hypothetical protein
MHDEQTVSSEHSQKAQIPQCPADSYRGAMKASTYSTLRILRETCQSESVCVLQIQRHQKGLSFFSEDGSPPQ